MAAGRLVFGFHAVSGRLKQKPDSVRELYVDSTRIDARTRELIALAAQQEVRVVQVASERLDRMLPGVRHQGVACSVRDELRKWELEDVLDNISGRALLLVLDGVQDPHNLGACLRVADAMGVHALIAPKDRAVALTPTVEKVASGAAETVPYVMVTNLARALDTIKDREISVVGTAGEAEQTIAGLDLCGPCALVLGAEGTGMRRLTRERCDQLVKIPMYGTVESLNVSVAAGICLYEIRRQRALPGGQPGV